MIFIGIDPGLNGAVGLISDRHGYLVYPDGENGSIQVYDTPTMIVSGAKEKRVYNTVEMANLLSPFKGQDALVILESVHSMPKQGVASSFSFGQGLGMWQGIIAALGLPLEMPSPQRWKKEILADQGKDKDASRFKAIQLFPSLATQLSRVKDDGRAEAILMAEYGRRLRKGK
jgi:crossover junction endodeoxyribonuclease RuvC